MKKLYLTLILLGFVISFYAREISFQIMEYNADAGAFVLKMYGEQPQDAIYYFENEYGATYGNRYNQIPRNKYASLFLYGWEGCRIDSITLSMCSNNSKGTAKLLVNALAYDGDSLTSTTVLHTMAAADFASDQWYGEWLSKDLGVYADITKVMQLQHTIGENEDVEIRLAGGTAEGSVYLHRITVHYTVMAPWVETVSPLGYRYEKLVAKSVLADNDTIMLYRSGNAAGDIDGMDHSHYLDAIGITSTNDVCENDVLHFVLHHDSVSPQYWYLTTLWGDTLGAQTEKHLLWNGGEKRWNIDLGYNGATIASANTRYGTLRFNAPAGSYARFWNYTSTSLVLPYIYRRIGQNTPVRASSLTMEDFRMVVLPKDTIVLKPQLLPATTTDERLRWQSSDTTVAKVRDGVVHILSAGFATITCTTWDGLLTANCELGIYEEPEPNPSNLTDIECGTGTYRLFTPLGLLVYEGDKDGAENYIRSHPAYFFIRIEK